MLRYVALRLLYMVPVLLVLSFVLFAFLRALPGGPAIALLGERATERDLEVLEQRFGLDRPVHEQYFGYMRNLARGDLGVSIRTRRPVREELLDRFPATVELSIGAILVAVLVGVPLGFAAAKRYQGAIDQSSLVASLIGISFPVFFLALLLKYVFAVRLGWLPTIGRIDVRMLTAEHPTGFYLLDGIVTRDWDAFVSAAKHLVLPAIALGTIPLAIITRITRGATLDVVSEDYVRTARAKGLVSSVVNRRHILRNAMLPVVTIVGLQVGLLLTGAILTETVFSWPGMGSWILEAIRFRDYAVLQGGILFFVLVVVLVNLLVDISYAFLNPRIRYR
ncbi:ABC transporter permease [soil metagenome]|jgi:peptide/nickel transport system permease protein|nr:ABC transporter permease [Euzebyaceae bacterium]